MGLNSPILGCSPDPGSCKLPTFDQAILETRQNVFIHFASPGVAGDTFQLDAPLTEVTNAGGILSAPQAVFNLVNIIVGVGVLSVPYALKQSGYFALVILVVVIYVTKTSGKWIGSSIDMAARTPLASQIPPNAWDFAFLAQAAVGRRFSVFMNIVTVLEVWLALVTFMIMNGNNAKVVWPSANRDVAVPLAGALASVLVFVPQRLFSYLSLLSTLAMIVAAAAMVASTYMLSQWAEPYSTLGWAAVIQPANIPRSCGILMFCFAGHPCFPAVRTSMIQGEKWNLCIDVSFSLACLFYGGFGFLGYIVFGLELDATVTENLAQIQGAHFCRTMAAFCFLIKVQLTVPLLLNAIVVSLWAPAEGMRQWPPLRVVLVLVISAVTILIALLLAHKVAIVASLAGSLLVMITSVLFPAAVHLILARRLERGKITWCASLEYAFVFVFGVTMAVLGTTFAVSDLAA
eukprot:TRINITY_DN7125_c0_g1_i1.p1 TRINITY_DN7125_c0_g1~~TRINITY_DN7125_c0_g1_i1.p1  ORF type:complete len:461 (-),score=51.54 TRINITY_DN7125_c0_g1_i1:482-1864(-)